MNAAQSSLDEGKLVIAYSDKNGSTVGLEFSSVASSQATLLMKACSVAASDKEKRIVTSVVMDDTEIIQTTSDDGGDDMDKRLAVLEAEVAHIKSSMAGIKEDTQKISSDSTDAKRDTAVLLQKSLDFDASLSKKPSVDYFEAKFSALETKIADVKVWMLGVLLASLAMPTIFFLINLYLKKGQ
ncbi:hypothetical protein OEE08_004932 [Escherichia coli]|nr:hypothetical protein [Escherichia coli]EJX6446247.1 hypothetical protein [Escherichia coli]ELI9752673.1 hypothetical protein [Escherichia coli]